MSAEPPRVEHHWVDQFYTGPPLLAKSAWRAFFRGAGAGFIGGAAIPSCAMFALFWLSDRYLHPDLEVPLWIGAFFFGAVATLPALLIGGVVAVLLARVGSVDSRRRIQLQGTLLGAAASLPLVASVGLMCRRPIDLLFPALLVACGALAGVRAARTVSTRFR